MYLDSILSKRSFEHSHSYDLIYEWEDDIKATLGIPFTDEKPVICGKLGRRIPFLFTLLMERKRYFYYDMFADLSINRSRNLDYVFPCIIDFYVSNKELKHFERNYRKNPCVFVSSKEAYDFLKRNDCQLNFAHLPLSISDRYKGLIINEKKYDVALMGRRNPVLMSFLQRYSNRHKGLRVIMTGEVNGQCVFCLRDKTIVAENNRVNWFEILRKTKIIFYHTPGVDGGEQRTKGFNQVTPRFLEGIVCGCHVLSRYVRNSDTDYYDFETMTCNIQSYEQFEKAMDRCLCERVDEVKYNNYILKHVTSNVAQMLKDY